MNKPYKQRQHQRTFNQSKKASTTKKVNSYIRIIAGKYKGRKLPVIDAEGLRPTTDRVKETVFNWLMPYLLDSQCLDCFAGAGSLGFEALSRGSEHVTMIELDKVAAKQLIANATLLQANNIKIIQDDALTAIKTTQQKYDLVLIDPPFRQGLVEQTIAKLTDNCLQPNALIYIEMESENHHIVTPKNWHLLKEKIAGQVSYRLFQHGE